MSLKNKERREKRRNPAHEFFSKLSKDEKLDLAKDHFGQALQYWQSSQKHAMVLKPGQGLQVILESEGDHYAFIATKHVAVVHCCIGLECLESAELEIPQELKPFCEHAKAMRNSFVHPRRKPDSLKNLESQSQGLTNRPGSPINIIYIHPGMLSEKDRQENKERRDCLPELKQDFYSIFEKSILTLIQATQT